MRISLPRKTWSLSVIASLGVLFGIATPAFAQDWLVAPPPAKTSIDANGVDLATGQYSLSTSDIGIGDLTFSRSYFQNNDGSTLKTGWRDSTTGTLTHDTGVYTVSFSGRSSRFTESGGIFTPVDEKRAKLSYTYPEYTYEGADGTVATFNTIYAISQAPVDSDAAVTSITTPSGEKRTYTYKSSTTLGLSGQRVRLQSINSNRGFQLKFEYESNVTSGFGWGDKWSNLTKVTAINNAVDYCDPTADNCSSLSTTWPSVTYGVPTDDSDARTVTDSLGRTVRYSYVRDTNGRNPRLIGIRRPTSTSDDVTIAYVTPTSGWHQNVPMVSSVTKGPLTWDYEYDSDSSSARHVTITGPGDVETIVRLSKPNGSDWQIVSVSDPEASTPSVEKAVTYTYDSDGRLKRITQPEGNYVENTYDAQGNITQTVAVGKSGSGISQTLQTIEYKAGCSSPGSCTPCSNSTHKLCHLPSKIVQDGVTTWLKYDATHTQLVLKNVGGTSSDGGLTISGGIETRYSYDLKKAWYKNSSGSIVEASTGIYLPTGTSICVSGNSCTGDDEEIVSSITYGATSTANNLLPTVATAGAGDASLSTSTTTTYDAIGRVATVDGPLSGSDDLTKYRYDLAGQVVGVIGPDPDGSGSLKHRAVRTTYNDDGQVTKVESGAVDSQSDTDWSAFSVLDYQTATYDAYGRKVRDTAYSGSNTALNVVQYSYDDRGRAECAAVRMNPSVFGSLPSSACDLSTEGSDGKDRISKTTYDDDNRVLKQIAGLGTPLEQDAVTYTYTTNGRVETELHGETA